MELDNETKYINKIFSLVQNIEQAKKLLKEEYNIDSEIKDYNTLVIKENINESTYNDIINTVYSLCSEDMVSVEINTK